MLKIIFVFNLKTDWKQADLHTYQRNNSLDFGLWSAVATTQNTTPKATSRVADTG